MKGDLEGIELNFNWIIYDLSGIIQLFEFIRTQRSIGFKTFSTIFSLYTQQNLVNLVEFAIEFNLIAISSRNIKGLRHQAVIIQWLEISVRGKLSICSFIIYISPKNSRPLGFPWVAECSSTLASISKFQFSIIFKSGGLNIWYLKPWLFYTADYTERTLNIIGDDIKTWSLE